MPIFAFYEYKISQRNDEEADLFKDHVAEDGVQLKHYDSPEACFGSFFRTNGKLPLNVLKAKGKGKNKIVEFEPYENDVLMVADDVILMTIENRYGADIVAQFGVEDEIVEEFEKGIKKMNFENPNGSFALIEWLDRMIELLPRYENETPVQKRGKRSRRR